MVTPISTYRITFRYADDDTGEMRIGYHDFSCASVCDYDIYHNAVDALTEYKPYAYSIEGIERV